MKRLSICFLAVFIIGLIISCQFGTRPETGRIKAVANLAGHASPATTLSLYVHDKFSYEEQQELLRKRKGR